MNVQATATTAVNMQLAETNIKHIIVSVKLAGENVADMTVSRTSMSVRRAIIAVNHTQPARTLMVHMSVYATQGGKRKAIVVLMSMSVTMEAMTAVVMRTV